MESTYMAGAHEAEVIPPKPDIAKPVRNKITPEQAAQMKEDMAKKQVGKTPQRPKPDIKINRVQVRRAKMTHTGLTPESHRCARIEYWLPSDHTYEDAKDPAYWEPIVGHIMQYGDFTGSIICVRKKDHCLYAELYVSEVSRAGIHVEELFYKEMGPQADDVKSERFTVIWNETAGGYDIIRRVDGVKVVDAKQMRRLQAVIDWLEKMEG